MWISLPKRYLLGEIGRVRIHKVRISPRIPRNGAHPSNTQTAIAPNPPWSMDLDSNPPTCCILPCGNVETREKTLYPEPGNNANISHQTETKENHRLKTAWGKAILVSSHKDRCMYIYIYILYMYSIKYNPSVLSKPFDVLLGFPDSSFPV